MKLPVHIVIYLFFMPRIGRSAGRVANSAFRLGLVKNNGPLWRLWSQRIARLARWLMCRAANCSSWSTCTPKAERWGTSSGCFVAYGSPRLTGVSYVVNLSCTSVPLGSSTWTSKSSTQWSWLSPLIAWWPPSLWCVLTSPEQPRNNPLDSY